MIRHLSGGVLLFELVTMLSGVSSNQKPANLVSQGRLTASSAATEPDGKYGVLRVADSDMNTHWASRDASLPQWIKVEWERPQTIDTVLVSIFSVQQADLYAAWKRFEIEFSEGTKLDHTLAEEEQGSILLRLDQPVQATWAVLRIVEVHKPKYYTGIDEFGLYHDPGKKIRLPRTVARPKSRQNIRVGPRREHPCVYVNREDIARARKNCQTTAWGRKCREEILLQAEPWLQHDEQFWLQFLPKPGACYAYGLTGCPICNSSLGTWGGARCRWDRPGKVECARGHVLPDDEHPDDGTGYRGSDGRIHYLIGVWNAWVTEQWTLNAIPALAHAYALTGEERYADRAAFFLDALASIYSESTAGSWDYPSSPPSGRFARPWYQVARTLVVFVEAYDLIYDSASLDKASLRPALEKSFPSGPTPQQRSVGTADAHGTSWEGMTRRDNIDLNLMQDGGYYCYEHTFEGALHNGHADYLRGALAVGALLNIPEYVHHALESSGSIYSMIANNCDRDGRYYETALGYALHARNLYLSFVEPLMNWRDEKYPQGVNLCENPQFRSFYVLPDLSVNIAGHAPNFGDCGPDNVFIIPTRQPYSASDYSFAEYLYAYTKDNVRKEFAQVLSFLAGGDVESLRERSNLKRWLLYHAEPFVGGKQSSLPAELQRRLFGSWFLGQKGLAILRDGEGEDAQGALLRYGPSLNHGDWDDLGLIYYGKGWQLTYEIGYGLASTHCHVGWASATASHTIVTVNESNQGGGSGGSLYLFADKPGFEVVEADSPSSYGNQKVTQYRRTVALIGEGKDQVLVDLFRVRGGHQHDYIVGSQGQEFTVAGIELGPSEEGSLAGKEYAWGEKVGADGDIIGFPNKPYWNPPPGNGYGFFYGVRRAVTRSPWWMEWRIGGKNETHFRVHILPEGDSEAIVAKAPGLYPHNRNASYLISRRRGEEGLVSNFAAVMEPFALPLNGEGRIGYASLAALVAESTAEVKLLDSLRVLLLKGTKPGDSVTLRVAIKDTDRFQIAARILKAPSYGAVRLLVDGKTMGEPFLATAPEVTGPERVVFGELELSAGTHEVRFEMTNASDRYYVGIASLEIIPRERAAQRAIEPKPVLERVERLKVEGGSPELTPIALHLRRAGFDEYLLSASLDESEKSVETVGGKLRWRGAVVYARFAQNRLVQVVTHGVREVQLGNRRFTMPAAAFRGKVRRVNYEERWVETDAKLPTRGLEGALVTFNNSRYTRNTAYRIHTVQALGNGSRILLGDQSLILGRGRVFDVLNEETMTSEIPHDYARSVIGGKNYGFFNGKLIRSIRGKETHLKSLEYANPMRLIVDSTEGFEEGDDFTYCDVQVGDEVIVPTTMCWKESLSASPAPTTSPPSRHPR